MLPTSATDALLQKLRQTDATASNCAQSARHMSVFITTATLSQWGVPYTVIDQRAPELVVTLPGAHHCGFNECLSWPCWPRT